MVGLNILVVKWDKDPQRALQLRSKVLEKLPELGPSFGDIAETRRSSISLLEGKLTGVVGDFQNFVFGQRTCCGWGEGKGGADLVCLVRICADLWYKSADFKSFLEVMVLPSTLSSIKMFSGGYHSSGSIPGRW